MNYISVLTITKSRVILAAVRQAASGQSVAVLLLMHHMRFTLEYLVFLCNEEFLAHTEHFTGSTALLPFNCSP